MRLMDSRQIMIRYMGLTLRTNLTPYSSELFTWPLRQLDLGEANVLDSNRGMEPIVWRTSNMNVCFAAQTWRFSKTAMGRYAKLSIATPMYRTQLWVVSRGEAILMS